MIPKWGNTARYHDMIIRASFVDDTYFLKMHRRNWTKDEWNTFLNCLMPRNTYKTTYNHEIYIQFTKLEHAFAYKERIKKELAWGEEE